MTSCIIIRLRKDENEFYCFDDRVRMMNTLKRFWNDEQGVAAIEYAIIAAVIAVGLIAAMAAIGTKVQTKMAGVDTDLATAGY